MDIKCLIYLLKTNSLFMKNEINHYLTIIFGSMHLRLFLSILERKSEIHMIIIIMLKYQQQNNRQGIEPKIIVPIENI